jgi:hypothetical protein
MANVIRIIEELIEISMLFFFHLYKNLGLSKLVNAGRIAKAPNKQKVIELITNIPKI